MDLSLIYVPSYDYETMNWTCVCSVPVLYELVRVMPSCGLWNIVFVDLFSISNLKAFFLILCNEISPEISSEISLDFFFKISVISAKIHLSLNVQVYTKFSKFQSKFVKFRVFWSWPKKNAKRNPKPWLHTPSQQPAKLLITAGSYTNTTMTPKTFRVQYVRYSAVCLSTAKARTMSSLCISGLLPCTLSVS